MERNPYLARRHPVTPISSGLLGSWVIEWCGCHQMRWRAGYHAAKDTPEGAMHDYPGAWETDIIFAARPDFRHGRLSSRKSK